MQSIILLFLGGLIMTATNAGASADPLLKIRKAPEHGIVIAPVNLTGMTAKAVDPTAGFRAFTLQEEKPLPVQFVPDGDFNGRSHAKGTLVLRLPRGGDWDLRLTPDTSPSNPSIDWAAIGTKHYSIRFDPNRMAGLPSSIELAGTGKRFENFAWNDRLYHPDHGQFWLRHSKRMEVKIVSRGDICTVLRIRAYYCQEDGKRPASEPEAVYDWYLFQDIPLAFVTAVVRQKEPFEWNELHFLEMNSPDESFRRWAGGEPRQEEDLSASQKSFHLNGWGALIDHRSAIGMFGGLVIVHDGRCQYGTYLHSTWQSWSGTEARLSTWLWIGSADDPAAAVQAASKEHSRRAQVVLTRPELQTQVASLRESARKQRGRAGQKALWYAALAESLEARSMPQEAEQTMRGNLPSGWKMFAAGDLGMALEQGKDGIRLQSLFDLKAGQEMLAPDTPPLFSLTLRHAQSKQQMTLAADAGWQQVKVEEARTGFTASWDNPSDERFKGIRVSAKAVPDGQKSAWKWSLNVENDSSDWTVWRIVFPQVSIAALGERASVLFPRGPGEVKQGVWDQAFTFRGTYPNGWCSMQLMAAYSEARETQPSTGLYLGLHDPWGSTKDIILQSDPSTRSVRFAYDHPAENMGNAGNKFTLSGEAVWQLLRGDWFDAAMIYKAWTRRQARWWPRLTDEGREDTPLWMREVSAWVQTGGAPEECVSRVREFSRYLGVPVGFHWYNWHKIPFDNDYPHYFPAKEGFEGGVKELKEAGVFVMPYINGRLWDTHDKGSEDFEFSKVALPFATKDEEGKPHVESYASKEEDGSPVRLAVMCPATKLWQDKVKEIVLRLQEEMGVNGVYIDQIAAASPVLCMDKTHSHPSGGGHWWNEGYWQMLDALRSAMPKDRMLTTECNSDPFVRWLDGYLTWHWQYDGQVPVFPAVYGGAVQMFGRAYGGGPTLDLALRMKAGQQLVFGEQIGWLDPNVMNEKENAAFFRQAVRLRWHLRRYFYAGEIARPPKLTGDIPTVRADWQWAPDWWVTTDAVLTGAWQLPKENKLILLFANVSDNPVAATLKLDGPAYGIRASRMKVQVLQDLGQVKDTMQVPSRFQRAMNFPPRTVFAWEISW